MQIGVLRTAPTLASSSSASSRACSATLRSSILGKRDRFVVVYNTRADGAVRDSFIVLEHDLFETTVDLAVGYTLDAARKHDPAFTVRNSLIPKLRWLIPGISQLKAIGECLSIPTYDMYKETAQTDIVGSNSTSSNSSTSSSGAATDSSGAAGLRIPSSAFASVAAAAVVAAFASSL